MNLLLVVLAALLVGFVSVSAAHSGTVQVIIRDSAERPVRDINVELLQVAEYINGSYVLTDEFAELGSFLRQEASAYNEKAEKAVRLYEKLPAKFMLREPDMYEGI